MAHPPMTKLDQNHIARCEHDEASHSKRVMIVETEMSIELDADDGDSVQVQPRIFEMTAVSGSVLDISKCKTIQIFYSRPVGSSASLLTVEMGPNSGLHMSHSTMNIVASGMGPVIETNALSLKLTVDSDADLDIFVIGKG